MALAKNPKQNYLRVRITAHRKPHSKEVAVSYTDENGVIHRTDWSRSQDAAEGKLRSWFSATTGIGRISFVVTQEVLDVKADLRDPKLLEDAAQALVDADWTEPHLISALRLKAQLERKAAQ